MSRVFRFEEKKGGKVLSSFLFFHSFFSSFFPFCEMVLNGIAVHVAIFLRLSCRVLLKNKLPPAEMKYDDAVSISDLLDVLDN